MLKPVLSRLFKMREDASRIRSGADDGYDPHEKPFLDHLEDLRKTLGKIIVTVMIATILAFVFNIEIFEFALQPIKIAGLGDKVTFFTLSPQEMLMLSIKVAFYAGLIGSFPLLMFFVGEFILPGLREQEKRFVLPGIGVGFALFLTGAAFAFYLAAPIALEFFYDYQQKRTQFLNPSLLIDRNEVSVEDLISTGKNALQVPDPNSPDAPPATPEVEIDPVLKAQILKVMRNSFAITSDSELHIVFDEESEKLVLSTTPIQKVSYRIGEYINFITRLVLVFGLAFQLPVVVTILVKLELLTARVMRTTRPMAWIIMLILSAVFTPPDIMTLALLAGPLIVLYEICIWIAWFIETQREKAKQAEESERQKRLDELYSKHDLSDEEKAELHAHEAAQYEVEHGDSDEEEAAQGGEDTDESAGSDDSLDHDHDDSWHDDHQEYSEDEAHYHQEHDEYGNLIDNPVDHEHSDDQHGAHHNGSQIVNLNDATLEELKTLPGVGPSLAQRLINHRPFGSFDDVLGVPGISEDKLNRMIDRLIIE